MEYSVKAVLDKADVVIALRIQRERHGEPFIPSLQEYAEIFGLSPKHLEWIKEGALLMHPGPINWGIELSYHLQNYPFQVILDQVTNGVAVRMSVLLRLLSGE